jgi:hypothetical protein
MRFRQYRCRPAITHMFSSIPDFGEELRCPDERHCSNQIDVIVLAKTDGSSGDHNGIDPENSFEPEIPRIDGHKERPRHVHRRQAIAPRALHVSAEIVDRTTCGAEQEQEPNRNAAYQNRISVDLALTLQPKQYQKERCQTVAKVEHQHEIRVMSPHVGHVDWIKSEEPVNGEKLPVIGMRPEPDYEALQLYPKCGVNAVANRYNQILASFLPILAKDGRYKDYGDPCHPCRDDGIVKARKDVLSDGFQDEAYSGDMVVHGAKCYHRGKGYAC